jgi:hypothetical protein
MKLNYAKPVFLILIASAFLLFVSSLNFTETGKFILYMAVFMFMVLFMVYFLNKKEGSEEVDLTFESY